MTSKERMIECAQGQLDAYNQRNLENFLTFYTKDVVVRSIVNNQLLSDNFETFTEMYRKRFAENLQLHCELKSRIVLNEAVLDEEFVTNGGSTGSHVVAIYHFRDNLISQVTFVR